MLGPPRSQARRCELERVPARPAPGNWFFPSSQFQGAAYGVSLRWSKATSSGEKFAAVRNPVSGGEAGKQVLLHIAGTNNFLFWKNNLTTSNSIKIYLPLDPVISFLDIHSEEIITKITYKDVIAKFFLVLLNSERPSALQFISTVG